MEKLAMQQEKAVTPEFLNEALRGSEAIRDVSTKVGVARFLYMPCFWLLRLRGFLDMIVVAPPPYA